MYENVTFTKADNAAEFLPISSNMQSMVSLNTRRPSMWGRKSARTSTRHTQGLSPNPRLHRNSIRRSRQAFKNLIKQYSSQLLSPDNTTKEKCSTKPSSPVHIDEFNDQLAIKSKVTTQLTADFHVENPNTIPTIEIVDENRKKQV